MPGSAITIAIKSFCLSYSPSFRTTFQFNLRTNYLFGQFQVSHMDNSMMSVLQFAVEALKVPHIVVCGHYECGGAKASLSQTDHTPPLSVWLRNIRDVQVIQFLCSTLRKLTVSCSLSLGKYHRFEQPLEVEHVCVYFHNAVVSFQYVSRHVHILSITAHLR